MKRVVLLFAWAILVLPLTAAAAPAQVVEPLRPAPTPEDTDSVLLLHGAFTYPGYWWDHTHLTVAVQAHPKVEQESLAAVRQAIADWDSALRQEFGGLITLTDATAQYTAKHKADIVLHYNPTAGGTVFGGYAICGAPQVPERDRPLRPAAEPRPRPVLAAVPVLRDDARARSRARARARGAAARIDRPDGLRLEPHEHDRAGALGVRPRRDRGRLRVGARRRRAVSHRPTPACSATTRSQGLT